MSKQIIDIGVQGNDGTGDSIRESFRKVNENFNEIYAVFGIEGTIGITNLSDWPTGTTYGPSQVIMSNTTGSKINARTLQAGAGITINANSDTTLTISSTTTGLSGDDHPTLAASLNANQLAIGRVADPSQELVTQFNAIYPTSPTTIDQLVMNKGYADSHYVKINTTGAVEGALNVRAEPLVPQIGVTGYDPTLTSNYLSTEAMQRKDTVYRGGDTMTGALTLSDHPAPLNGYGTPNGSDDLQAATKFYVDNATFSSGVNLYVSTTSGDDLQQKSPVGKEGRFWQYAYKTVGAAALAAQNLQDLANQEPGPYRQRITYTIGPDQYFSTIQGVTLTGGNTADTGYVAAFDLLQANRNFIQTETIAYINNKYVNDFTYDREKCARDVQLILDAVGYDLVLGTTFNTTRAASGYFNATSNKVLSGQLVQTIEAMKFARDEILNFSYDSAELEIYIGNVIDALCYDLIFQSNYQSIQVGLYFPYALTKLNAEQMADVLLDLNSSLLAIQEVTDLAAASTSISSNINNIINIINGKDLPAVSIPNLSGTSTGISSARDLLLANIDFLQAEAVAFLGAEYPNLPYDKIICKRDIKYIAWSLIYDMVYGGNSQSRYAGLRYWNGATENIATAEIPAIQSTLTYINTLMQSVIVNGSPTTIYQQSVKQYRNETLSGGTAGSSSISTNIAIIQSIITASSNAPAVINPTVSAAADVLESVRTAILLQKDDLKTASVTYVESTFPVINDPTILASITSLFQIPIDLLTFGIATRALPTYTSPSGLGIGYTHARQLLIANLDFIADEAAGWIAAQVAGNTPPFSTGFTYNVASCKRDIKYMLEGIAYDITYGGNTGSTYAGLQYWQNAVEQLPVGQIAATKAALTFVSNLAVVVAENTAPGTLYSSTPQYTSGALTGGSVAASTIAGSFSAIKLIIDDAGAAPAYVYPSTVGFDANLIATRNIIVANKSLVSSDTITFLDTNYAGGFNYDESICFRDLGLIVDAMSIDLLTAGTWQSVTSGKSYYRNASARAIAIGTQYTETVDAITFAKTLALQVLNKTLASRYQSLVSQVTIIGGTLPSATIGVAGGSSTPTVSTPAKTDFSNNMDIILNIIEHGYGAAPTPSYGTGIWNLTITNGGNNAVDQGLSGNVDIIPAMVVVGINSVAYSSVVKYLPNSSSGVDTIQTRLSKPGFYQIGEQVEFGATVKDLHITIFVESGIYYEDYPIKLPTNVSIKGDEFRRTLIRPRDRISQSPWRKVFFYRDAIIDALELGPYDTSTNYATSTTISIGGTTGSVTISLGVGQVPQSWINKIIKVPYSTGTKVGRAVVDSVSGKVMNCTVIYPFEAIATIASGSWQLYGTINYGRFYLTNPLDINSAAKNNKDIDVLLCNDQTRVSNITFQGHGGFAMVLDPEGQIKTKSPYGQVCSSFSQSNNKKRFAGGQFVDGFAGRLFGTITNVADAGITITVVGTANSGLDIRPPQPPCAFYVQGSRYQVNDVVSFNSATATVVLTLDVATPYYAAGMYNNTTCSRDIGLILDAVTYDMVIGSNFQAVRAGLSYLRADASAVVGTQQTQTLSGINKARDLALATITGNAPAIASISSSISTIDTIITQGLSAAPTITFPTGTNSTTQAVKLKNNLQNNKAFVQAEITAWISANYVVKTIPLYSAVTCARDVGYIIDSMCYDIMYGGNSMTFDAVLSYYGRSVSGEAGSNQITGEEAVTTAAYGRMKVVLQQIALNTTVSKSAGNIATQTINAAYIILNTDTEYSKLGTLHDLVTDYTADGVTAVSRTTPTITSLDAGLLGARTTVLAAKSTIQTNTITYLNNGGGLVINIEMGGNKSMLANDFAMINDLGYAIVTTNGAVSEQVSTFTYYCHTHYWANNGGQIRSVAGSNAHGNYGLRASGFDVTEKPDAVTLAKDMVQTAKVYKQGAFASEMTPTTSKQALSVYITGYSYIPYNTSELEIDHTAAQGVITRYEVTSVEHTSVTIGGQNIIKLNLGTAGSNGTSSTGLAATLYDGQTIVIRILQNIKFNGIDNVKPTRPSTAVQYIDDLASIYRVIAYNLTESTGEILGSNIAVLQSDSSFNYYKFVTDLTNIGTIDPTVSTIAVTGASGTGSTVTLVFANQGSAPYSVGQSIVVNSISPIGYNGVYVVTACTATSVSYTSTYTTTWVSGGKIATTAQGAIAGDNKIAVLEISTQTTIDQINKGIFIVGWAGRTHRVSSYTTPLAIATGTYVSGGIASTTMVVSNVAGSIDPGDIITGTGFNGSQTVVSATQIGSTTSYTVITSAVVSGPISGTITFGITRNGWLNLDTSPIANNTGDGTSINALSFNSKAALGTSTVKKAVTYDVSWSPATLPIVDAVYNITGQTSTGVNYNGSKQVVGAVSKTQITVTDTSTLTVGMIVSSVSAGAYIPSGTIIQTIDSLTQFTVSPACWIPSGAVVSSTVVATINTISITNGGSGYTTPPTITIGQVPAVNGEISPGIATCTIDANGSIDKVTIVSPGYGYTSTPTIYLSEVKGSALLTATLTATATTSTTASAGASTNQITVAYDTDPGTFILGTGVTITSFTSKTGPATFTGAISGTTLTVSSVTGTIAIGQGVTGTGVSSGTYITAGSGTTWTVSISQSVTSVSMASTYAVILAFGTTTAPTVGAWFHVTGNTNPLYNGFYRCAASSSTSVTLSYLYDPGTWSTATTTTIAKEVTTATTNSLGISKPFPTDASTTLRLGYPVGTAAQITTRISTCRATGHDFLDIGTGSYSTTNYPYQIYGNPSQSKDQSHEIVENGVGRVFYVTTDQNGIFRVGRFFTVDQGTGTVTFSASIALSNLDGLGFKRGVVVSEFSTDSSFTNNAPEIVPVQSAIRGYIDKRLGLDHGGAPVAQNNLIGPGYLALNGSLSMKGSLNMATFSITNLANPSVNADAANKLYVDTQVALYDQLSELRDVNLTTPADGSSLVYDNATSKWIDVPVPTGDVNITYSAGVFTTTIQSNKIVNSMVSSTAGIVQSKLSMTAASTRANATSIAQADLGLASFYSSQFVATNGWIRIKPSTDSTTGVTLDTIQYIGGSSVLGRRDGTSGIPTELSVGQLVTDGNGIKNAPFTAAGAMVVSSYADSTFNGVTNTGGGNSYSVVGITSSGAVNNLVKTTATGDIVATGFINAPTIKVSSYKTIDVASTTVNFYTPGAFNFATATGTSGANTVISTYGTLDTSNGTLKATTVTTGGSATSGTIVGQWQVLTSSQIDVSAGTLKSTTLTTGADATGGTIQGTWSLTGASKLQATYADIAEFYEGDKEYEPGTVLVFGGDKEVTTTDAMNDTRSAGVVTTNPAYVMNQEQTGIKVCIALAGRVPCKVIGRVKKGDLLTTSATIGYAMKANDPKLGAIIGKALEDKDYGEAGVIQVAVGRV
ncbi:hypothetical protein UFOVP181_240 [uncultured Caudovirales phage]|uniref:Uncharacterized protein n=1 Tax=uncultured Caudovirales phage TaxID=2100421 RepID=A0A6J5KU10_9CAUD|nr:hypothetical protein UFOVP57_399 [uncultured Caudovirales phage]CAB5208906.1 hypothetical protein UFOVP181_240 [uncultured Caudovirales phage]